MKVSHKAIEMIKHHEGVRTRAYRCPALLWTIGVGHVIDPAHGKVKLEDRKALPIPTGWDRVISMKEVDDILAADLERFERGVEQHYFQSPFPKVSLTLAYLLASMLVWEHFSAAPSVRNYSVAIKKRLSSPFYSIARRGVRFYAGLKIAAKTKPRFFGRLALWRNPRD